MTYPVKKYDAENDVLHVYLRRYKECESSAEEPVRDIYVLYDDETDEITGFKILDYKRNVAKAQAMYPQYNFSLQ